jgi:hypothetical protein
MAPPDSGSPLDRGSAVAVGIPTRVTLHLGVLVQPYRHWELNPKKTKRVKGAVRPVTTGDVAEFLEAKYGLMGTFYKVHEHQIVEDLENSIAGALETMVMRRQPVPIPWDAATQKIQARFRDFISSKEAERVGITGTPTKAALRGVNHRLKHPYRRGNPRRPSFRDTYLYMNSFRAWTD